MDDNKKCDKSADIFECEICDFRCSTHQSLNHHMSNHKHQKITNDNDMRNKSAEKFECKYCDFKCSKQSNYDRHISTRKHQRIMEIEKKSKPSSSVPDASFICSNCNKSYSYMSGLCRHKNKCTSNKKEQDVNDSPSDDMSQPITHNEYNKIIGLLHEIKNKENDDICDNSIDDCCLDENIKITATEIKNMFVNAQLYKKMMFDLIKSNHQLQEQVFELMKKTSQPQITPPTQSTVGLELTGDNNTINANSNNNNKAFNMNFFLNEQCKDAMNMKDFVNSIQLNFTDLENVGRLGYVEGMSNILIDNLQKTDIYKRPVHCSDVKRETLYVKDDNKWEREGPNHQKMVNAVLAVEHKNVALVNEWAKAHPLCMNSNSRDNETYMKLSKTVTDGEKEGNIQKVIRKVSKKVAVEKDGTSITA